MQTGEASYEITVGYYIGTQLMDTQTLQYLYDRSAGRWVFSDTVSVLFCWLDNISLSWG
ncbi:MAG: hypothetical protein IKD79_02810 [Oscillospiraceae bacterium]|nr:hypothetical protein [Oscillospiraceae bacterium]